MLARRWRSKGILKGGVVGTLMSNYGLEKFLRDEKIKFYRSKVGDRYVKEMMKKFNFNLGGEQSGHIILGKFATTGDSLMVALEVLFSLRKRKKASKLLNIFKSLPQILVNISVKDQNVIDNLKLKSKILIIAGSDSSGGAGIQADIKTVTALGGYAMTAVTAITAQNTRGVNTVVPIKSKEISKQILFTCKDIKPNSIKIGMLHSSQVIDSVSRALKHVKTSKIILDPVMIAKGGTRLINKSAIKTLKDKLIKKAYLLTPNIPEAEILTKTKIKNLDDMIHAANILLKFGAKNILLKGGHRKSKYIQDVFLNKKEVKIFKNIRIKTKNTHGTGCTLSSAIATFLSCGKPLKKSCELGIKYVNQAIGSNPNFGKGHGPINHLNSIIINKKFR